MSQRFGFIIWAVCLCLAGSAFGQMSVDEAMARLREREAARAADLAAHPTPATRPAPKIVDLSARVQDLDSSVSALMGAKIDPIWAPAEIQEWLNNQSSKCADAARKLVNAEAPAKIIIDTVSRTATGVTIHGHLFPVTDRLTMTRSERGMLQPFIDSSANADQNVSNLQSQINNVNNRHAAAQMDLNMCTANSGSNPNLQGRIAADEEVLNETSQQVVNLQTQLTSAQGQVAASKASLAKARQSAVVGAKSRMQIWGPIILNSQDPSLLDKLPGNIFTVPVRVTSIDVSVVRSPDAAGWDFSSDAANDGLTHMPTFPEASGPQAATAGAVDSILISCQQIMSPSASPVISPDSPGPTAILASDRAVVTPHSPGQLVTLSKQSIVSSPKDETAMTAAVGFVVVGVQAIMPDGRIIQRPVSSGSAFTVTSNGYLLTNHHVVEDLDILNNPTFHSDIAEQTGAQIEPHIWVFFGAAKYEATVIFISDKFDMAVLKIARPGQPFFHLAAKTNEVRATDVFAAGFPGLGHEALGARELHDEMTAADALNPQFDIISQFKPRDFEYTLTKGIVSRVVPASDGQLWIQHEALIRHGNSGGPLMTGSGVVLGINTWAQHNEEGDVQTNMTLDIAQLRPELDARVPGLVWVNP